jgi:hypothetical protein
MKKKTVNEYISIDIRKIKDVFKPKTRSAKITWAVEQPSKETTTLTAEVIFLNERIYLENPFNSEEAFSIPILLRKVHFGWRKVFQCPYCNRRCDILYFGPEDYGCRKCLDLIYPSVQESHKDDKLLKYLFPNMPLRLAKKALKLTFNKAIGGTAKH